MPDGMMGLLLENRNAGLELERPVAAGHPNTPCRSRNETGRIVSSSRMPSGFAEVGMPGARASHVIPGAEKARGNVIGFRENLSRSTCHGNSCWYLACEFMKTLSAAKYIYQNYFLRI
jgi:hypothetical protein